jgi:hypothetical protein
MQMITIIICINSVAFEPRLLLRYPLKILITSVKQGIFGMKLQLQREISHRKKHCHQGCRTNLLSIKRSLDFFETLIRGGLEHNNPPIIYIYLKQIEDLVSTEKVLSARFVIARRAFHLLYDTIADKTIEVHWRELCLDNVNVPLHLMKNNLDSPQIRNQYRQIQYNLTSLCIRS